MSIHPGKQVQGSREEGARLQCSFSLSSFSLTALGAMDSIAQQSLFHLKAKGSPSIDAGMNQSLCGKECGSHTSYWSEGDSLQKHQALGCWQPSHDACCWGSDLSCTQEQRQRGSVFVIVCVHQY